MKIEKQTPLANVPDSQARQRPPSAAPHKAKADPARHAAQDAGAQELVLACNKSAKGFNLQLNQQLSSLQAADRYLGELSDSLSTLKLSVSRQLSSPQTGSERDVIAGHIANTNNLLAERSKRSGQSLDAGFKLRLNEPLRSRFSIQGLESLAGIQSAGKETLVFTAGRAMSEPVALVLDEVMTEEQILRRVNASFANVGIRAELDANAKLTFLIPENDWPLFQQQLKIKGEGGLFPALSQPVVAHEEGLLALNPDLARQTFRELRQLLDSVVGALDRISNLRQHISLRQEDVREFLAQQESQDEKQWALNFASAVFNIQGHTASSYSVVAQTVVAQAQLTRFAVVSLLS